MKAIEENQINLPKLYRQSVMTSFYSSEYISINGKLGRQMGSTTTHLGCLLEMCILSKINALVIYSYKETETFLQRMMESNNIMYNKFQVYHKFIMNPFLSTITFRERLQSFEGINCDLMLILDYPAVGFRCDETMINKISCTHCSRIIVEEEP